MTNAAYSAYAQSSFGGIESPTKLIEMLYDGILRFIFRTKKAIEAGNVEKKVLYINKANAIFVELLNSLDYSQGDVAHYLSGLYARQMQLLVLANLNNDVNALNEITNVVKQLSEAWREVTNEQ
ncbi:flagellar export chaperone FliS [uncultured Campylobacter sp.]|uniref:flagellar export chaperone FliS n=1 Tax=uncultured Campylobacter sp. TaxID=218934 RepID=UPI0025FA7B56|nr:flagellar export chaperone FliS [uncultured Campylobacter sp.]